MGWEAHVSHASLRSHARGAAAAGERGAGGSGCIFPAGSARPSTAAAQLGPGRSEKQWADQMVMNRKQDRFPGGWRSRSSLCQQR